MNVYASVQQAFLVQNSGWMEPFYTDPNSQFKPLISAVANAVINPTDQVHVLAFNQSTTANISPQIVHKGVGSKQLTQAVNSIHLAKKAGENSKALADTDFKEAITKTIVDSFQTQSGIIWIFTNNKNSPNNDIQTAERNLEFYRLLHLEPSIVKTIVFPLRMEVRGNSYQAKGLMVYGLAYGQAAATALDNILKDGKLTKILTQPYAKLKPLDQDAVSIIPEKIVNSPNITLSQGADNRTVILDVESSKYLPQFILQGSIKNQFYPYTIAQARVTANLTSNGKKIPVLVDTQNINGLEPGAKQNIKAKITMPFAQVPSPWSSQALSAMGKEFLVPVNIEIGLTDQQLILSQGFVNNLKELFPGDPISEVFTPPENVRSSIATIPMIIRVQYPVLPLILLILGLFLLVGLLLWLLFAFKNGKTYRVKGNNVDQLVKLYYFGKALKIYNNKSEVVASVKLGFGMPKYTPENASGIKLSFSKPK